MLRHVADGASAEFAMVCRNFETRIGSCLMPTKPVGVDFHFVIVAGAQRFQVMTDFVKC
jgi:hypothetical protein